MSSSEPAPATGVARRAAGVAAGAGIALAMMETASILSQPGAAIASPMDLAVLVTWLALPYTLLLGGCALAAGLALRRPAGFDAAFAGAAVAGAVLLWLHPLARLGEGTASHLTLELALVAVSLLAGATAGLCAHRRLDGVWIAGGLAGLALMLAQSRNVPGPFGRPLPPPHIALRLALAAVAAGLMAGLVRWLRGRHAGVSRHPRWARGAALAAGGLWLSFAGYAFTGLLVRSAPEPSADVQAATAASDGPNIVLISVDTLRADHLSCYGYGRAISPEIDRLASEGVRFELSSSTASFTLPSHASMMTGLFPTSHGATYQNRDPESFTVRGMGAGYPTLAEILRDHGYETAGFVSGPLMSGQFGFARGFAIYDDRYDRLASARARLFARSLVFRGMERAGLFSAADVDSQRIASEVNPLVEAWLARRGDARRPFFLFVHYWDPHGPYDPPAPWGRREDGSRIVVDYDMDRLLTGTYTLTPRALADTLALYDGEVSFVDQQVGRLLDLLRRDGTLDRTLVVFTADHGESFGEHAHWEHSRVLYEDLLRVPFILRLPGGKGAGTVVRDVIAQPTDILPIALSVAGLPPSPGAEGRDLTQWFGGAAPPSAPAGVRAPGLAFAELDRNVDWPKRWGARFDRDLASARTLRWKYIRSSTGGEELYDLHRDPGETDDRAAAEPGTTATLRALLEAWRRSLHGPGAQGGTEEIDEGLKDNLRSLGYIQ